MTDWPRTLDLPDATGDEGRASGVKLMRWRKAAELRWEWEWSPAAVPRYSAAEEMTGEGPFRTSAAPSSKLEVDGARELYVKYDLLHEG